MDFPVFHLDFLNNRMLIAMIAVLHVFINHAMAVGGIPLVVYLEARGLREGDQDWDRLALRILTFFFVITTTVGALTGVGIWFSAGLVNPYAIGSLIRVFFWTWFVEWLVFVTEVVLILYYYLTWSRWTGADKARHVRLGQRLAFASWATMALIVSILSFMMDPGSWHSDKTLFSGMFNPVYLPQLAFRTPLAMLMAGALGLAIVRWADESAELRARAIASLSRWILFWSVPTVAGGLWYVHVIPDSMRANVPVALLTQALATWSDQALRVLAGCGIAIVLLAVAGLWRPKRMALPLLILPSLLTFALLGTFERVREFVRKPYAIADYLYANGFRKADYPLLARDGVLTHATYTSIRSIDSENEVEAGRELFTLTCTRCHTVDGVNGIRGVLTTMYGMDRRWDPETISLYVGGMHNARPFMPPFPGTKREREALGRYLAQLQFKSETLEGAQQAGVRHAPPVAQSLTVANASP
jgi:hypothetical protein